MIKRKLLEFLLWFYFLISLIEQNKLRAKAPLGPLQILPEGKGQSLVIQNCTACHSPYLLRQQRLDQKQWLTIIQKMQKEHGLWPIAEKVQKIIANYLAKNFGPSKEQTKNSIMSPRAVNPLPKTKNQR